MIIARIIQPSQQHELLKEQSFLRVDGKHFDQARQTPRDGMPESFVLLFCHAVAHLRGYRIL